MEPHCPHPWLGDKMCANLRHHTEVQEAPGAASAWLVYKGGLRMVGDVFSIAPLLQKHWKSGSQQHGHCSHCLAHITNIFVRSMCTQAPGNRNSPGLVGVSPCTTPWDPGFLREPFPSPCPPPLGTWSGLLTPGVAHFCLHYRPLSFLRVT